MDKRKRKPQRVFAPMIVMSTIDPTYTTRLYLALAAFEEGMGVITDFHLLLDCIDLLILGASNKQQNDLVELCKILRIALENTHARFKDGELDSSSEDEIQAFKEIVKQSEAFWKRQSGDYYRRCSEALKAFRQKQKEKLG